MAVTLKCASCGKRYEALTMHLCFREAKTAIECDRCSEGVSYWIPLREFGAGGVDWLCHLVAKTWFDPLEFFQAFSFARWEIRAEFKRQGAALLAAGTPGDQVT